MIMLGMNGWKLEIQGGAADLKRFQPSFFERLLDRIFGGKMLVVFAIKGGKPMLAKRSEIVLAEAKEDPLPAEEQPAASGRPELAKPGMKIPHKQRPS